MVQLNVKVPDDVSSGLHEQAASRGVSLGQLMGLCLQMLKANGYPGGQPQERQCQDCHTKDEALRLMVSRVRQLEREIASLSVDLRQVREDGDEVVVLDNGEIVRMKRGR